MSSTKQSRDQVLREQLLKRADLRAWLRFLRAHAAITRELSARLEADHGMTLSDYDVLIQLEQAPGQRLRRVDLSRRVLLSASGITRLLDGLERAGWVEKGSCETDARVTYAVLTAAGAAKCAAASASHIADIGALFGSQFSEEEAETLAELLGRLPLAETSPACTGDE
jgi:DNA-binding MarR family transcriptional regulator